MVRQSLVDHYASKLLVYLILLCTDYITREKRTAAHGSRHSWHLFALWMSTYWTFSREEQHMKKYVQYYAIHMGRQCTQVVLKDQIWKIKNFCLISV